MAQEKVSMKAYANWKEASEKFDYYVLGATGALCAWIIGTLPSKGGNWSLVPQALGLALIIVSTWASYRRIECSIRLHSLTIDRTQLEERREERVIRAKAALGTADGYDPVAIDKLDAAIAEQKAKIDNWKARGARLYRIRDRTLMVGFIVYAVGRIWAQFT